MAPHVRPNPAYVYHHLKAKLTGSSRRVFVKGIGVGRKGDKADWGAMIGASFNVFAG